MKWGRTEKKEKEKHSQNARQELLLLESSEEHGWKQLYLALKMQL